MLRLLATGVLLAAAVTANATETQTIYKYVRVVKPVKVYVDTWVEEEVTVQRLEHTSCRQVEVLVWDSFLSGYIRTWRHEPVYEWVAHKEVRRVLRSIPQWRERVTYELVPEVVPIPEVRTTWPHAGQL